MLNDSFSKGGLAMYNFKYYFKRVILPRIGSFKQQDIIRKPSISDLFEGNSSTQRWTSDKYFSYYIRRLLLLKNKIFQIFLKGIVQRKGGLVI